jgi:hypothetical protein
MSDVAAPSAKETDKKSRMLDHVVSARNATASIQATHKEMERAQKPVKKSKPAAKKADDGAAPKKQRNQVAHILGVAMPPPRVDRHIRAGILTEKCIKHADLTDKIKSINNYIKDTPPATEAEIASGARALTTPEQRAAGIQKIKEIEEYIRVNALASDIIRVSEDSAHVLSSVLTWILLTFFDVVAANTVASDHKIVEVKYTLDPEFKPSIEAGGVDLAKSPVAVFLMHLSQISGYSPEKEAERAANKRLLGKEKENAKAKKDQETAAAALAAATAAAHAAKAVSEGSVDGGDAAAATAAVLAARLALAAEAVPEKAPPSKRKEGTEMSFNSYAGSLCKTGNDLHPDYKMLRTSSRLKELMDEMTQEFIENFSAAVRPSISTHTLTGNDVRRMYEAMQRQAGRPEEEVLSLRAAIEQTLNIWKTHTASEKVRQSALATEKFNNMNADERARLELKQKNQEVSKLKSSFDAQVRRADKASKDAANHEINMTKIAAEASALKSAVDAVDAAAATAAAVDAVVAPVV